LKFGEIIKKEIAVICIVVLLFAIKLTLMGFFPKISVKNCLKEEMINSLDMINNEGIIKISLDVNERRYTKGIQINNLSAVKSNKAPRELLVSVFLAT